MIIIKNNEFFSFFLYDYIYYFLFAIILIKMFKLYVFLRNYFHNSYGSIGMWPMMPAEYKLSCDEIIRLKLKYKNQKLKEIKSDGNIKVQSSAVKKC